MKLPANRLLLALAITAVLLCHGAFGVWHQFSGHASGVSVVSVAEPGSAHHEAGAFKDSAESHAAPAASYEVAPMLLLLGAVLVLLLRGARLWRWSAAPGFPRCKPLGFSLPPPAAPEAAVLQVFRL